MAKNSLSYPEFNLKEFPYRVWTICNPPHVGTLIPVKTVQEGINLIELITANDITRDDIQSNIFGLEFYCSDKDENGNEYGWEEWYDEDGNDIITVIDNL